MKLSEIAAIIEQAAFYDLVDIHQSEHGVRAKLSHKLPGNGVAEVMITVSAHDLTQARYPDQLIGKLTCDANIKLARFLDAEAA